MKIGVLAVQGNFREHAAMLRRLGADAVEVRKPEQLQGLDGLVIPGGESTTFMRLMRLYGLDEAVRKFTGPVLGTCAVARAQSVVEGFDPGAWGEVVTTALQACRSQYRSSARDRRAELPHTARQLAVGCHNRQ